MGRKNGNYIFTFTLIEIKFHANCIMNLLKLHDGIIKNCSNQNGAWCNYLFKKREQFFLEILFKESTHEAILGVILPIRIPSSMIRFLRIFSG